MLTDNRTAAHGMNANFICFTLFYYRMAVIHILICITSSLIDRVRKHDGCTAWGVNFLIMMLFNNFNIKLSAKNRSCLFDQFCKQIYTD